MPASKIISNNAVVADAMVPISTTRLLLLPSPAARPEKKFVINKYYKCTVE